MKRLSRHIRIQIAGLCAAAMVLTALSSFAVAASDGDGLVNNYSTTMASAPIEQTIPRPATAAPMAATTTNAPINDVDLMVYDKITIHDYATITRTTDGSWDINALQATSIGFSGCNGYDVDELKYMQIGILSDVNFKMSFYDEANSKWMDASADFASTFGVSFGNPIPAGKYTKVLDINDCYAWLGSLPSSVHLTSIYIEPQAAGRIILSTMKLSSSSVYYGKDPTIPHSHILEAVVAKAPTCTQNGNIAYWKCDCGAYFSDENGEDIITLDDTVLASLGHDFTEKLSDTEHLKSTATCTSPAIYYCDCSRCYEMSDSITFVKGEMLGHDFNGEYDGYDNTYHWHICTRDNCNETNAKEAHSGGTANFFERATCEVCEHKYGNTTADTTVPTGKISISDNHWREFSNTISFNLFFKETKIVTVSANDTESGVAKIEYLLSSSVFHSETDITGTWLDITAAKRFGLDEKTKQYIYVRVTDAVGNASIINSDGIVIYSDCTITPQHAVFDKNIANQTDIVFTVDLNGNALKDIKNGTNTLVNGTDYTVSGNTVTIKKSYLVSQNIGSISLTFSFYPMNEITDEELSVVHVVITDGITTETQTNPDGSTIVTKKDAFGNVLEVTVTQPDGRTEVTENKPDGSTDITKKDSSGNITEKTVINADDSSTTTEYKPDGSTEVTEKDSSGDATEIIVTYADGRTEVTENKSNGTTEVTKKDSSGDITEKTVINADDSSTTTEYKPDGSTDITKKDSSGNITEIIVTYADGRTEITENKSDGTTEVTKKDSSGGITEKTVINADGSKTVTTYQNDGTSSTKKYDSSGKEVADQNDSSHSPKTGGSSNITIYIVLLLISGGVLTVFFIAQKRKKATNK